MYYPSLEEVKRCKKEGNLIPICREVVADLDTPVSAFLKINRNGYSFLLESVEGGQRLARYSFIGTEPYKVLTVSKSQNADPLPLAYGKKCVYATDPQVELLFDQGAFQRVGDLSGEGVGHAG